MEDRNKLTQIQEIVRLIKKVNCTTYALITEIAKEAGMKKTAVMAFIETYPKLFDLVEVKKGNKNLGLGVKFTYNSADENPATEEWLERKRKEWDKKLHIHSCWYYNCLEFLYIDTDIKDHNRYWEYRNTEEKVAELEKKGLKRQDQCYGGLGDCSKMKDIYVVTHELLKVLEDNGWTTDYEEVCAKNNEMRR